MHRLLKTLATLIWGTWFGSLIMLFLTLTSIFQTFADRLDLAGQTASGIFHLFNRFRLVLAFCLIVVLGMWWIGKRSGRKSFALALTLVAAGAAVYSTAFLTPQIEHLRVSGLTQSSDFTHLHGISMVVYMLETIVLFAAGVLLPNIDKPSAV